MDNTKPLDAMDILNMYDKLTKEDEAFLASMSKETLDVIFGTEKRDENKGLSCCSNDVKGRDGVYRCKDCFGSHESCKACIASVRDHNFNPLHRIERWSGSWKRDRLERLGLVVQVGHPAGDDCDNPVPAKEPLIVIHENGVHRVRPLFCGCEDKIAEYRQLLRLQWFPVTPDQLDSGIVFTLTVLEKYLGLPRKDGKLDTHARAFCTSLQRLTGDDGLEVPDFYDEFLFAVTEYEELLKLKRERMRGGPSHGGGSLNGANAKG